MSGVLMSILTTHQPKLTILNLDQVLFKKYPRLLFLSVKYWISSFQLSKFQDSWRLEILSKISIIELDSVVALTRFDYSISSGPLLFSISRFKIQDSLNRGWELYLAQNLELDNCQAQSQNPNDWSPWTSNCEMFVNFYFNSESLMILDSGWQ